MASTPKLSVIDWNSINIWCCDQFFTPIEIVKHTQKVHCQKENEMGNIKTEIINAEDIQSEKKNQSLKINEAEKLPCDLCPRSFKNKQSLNRHKRNIHEGIQYSCNLCEYTAAEKYNLKIHIENKHQGIWHACDFCQFKGTTIRNLTQHKKMHLNADVNQAIVTVAPQSNDAYILPSPGKPSPKKKRKPYNSSTKEVLICEPDIEYSFSLSQKKRKSHVAASSTVHTHFQTSRSTEQENMSPMKLQSEDLQNNSAIPDETVKITFHVESHEDKEVPDVKVKDGVLLPGYRIVHNFMKHPSDKMINQVDEDDNDLKEQAMILKFHSKQDKLEKRRIKWDVQRLKRQEQIRMMTARQNRKQVINVNVEVEQVETPEPNIEDITDILVDEKEEEPVIAFGFVVPNFSKVPFSLPWLSSNCFK